MAAKKDEEKKPTEEKPKGVEKVKVGGNLRQLGPHIFLYTVDGTATRINKQEAEFLRSQK